MNVTWVKAMRAAALGAALLSPSAVCAADTVIVGTVGSASANLWPVHIGIDKSFVAAEGLAIDLVYAQSNMAVVRAAGSVNVSVATRLVDPIRASDKGAPVAIARIEVRAPPYARCWRGPQSRASLT
jgi:NitT/TauT family transport system substrate-binding protein